MVIVRWIQRAPTGPIGADIIKPTKNPLKKNEISIIRNLLNNYTDIIEIEIRLNSQELYKQTVRISGYVD
ncbi:MAG: hypothetical protein DHS20C13_11900 [Thermodesulfobacteriota bacterium]|nr:MAG: hypothetical protein DHS20C13_11900 [Thermodesulfobacteriota bacterium]